MDHLAIGPAGVFSINSKSHRGKTVWYGDTAVTMNGSPTRRIAVGQSEARRISRVLSTRCGVDVPVRPVISAVNATKLTGLTVSAKRARSSSGRTCGAPGLPGG
ncbi:nuclease-related domain-containing protein [Streptomyces glaucescens]|uniref:nuclease-related domain-containing protein n=1 Tax=Streptomyces glaucescens TaxID=1907 RepID=UPI00244BB464|nr:nuclease-related domain-containing protein [Streptomyces glaucescens]